MWAGGAACRRTAGVVAILSLAGGIAGCRPGEEVRRSPPARSVILFLGDAAGLATLHGASVHGHGRPRGLYLHTLPHLALAETSTASEWVADSAAAMTAIVTGSRTHNGVVAQSDSAVRGTRDGEPLKTILEHAEERGLATGIVSTSSVLSATPAACYAHVNDRRKQDEVLRQLLEPAYGDGVDVLIGGGLDDVVEAASRAGLDARGLLGQAGLELYASLDAITPDARRAAVLFPGGFDLDAATQRAIDVLSRNPKGYFLMVEGDVHVEELVRGLDRTVELDRALRNAAERVGPDTLILFTADHSYDFRIHDGRKGEPLLPGVTDPRFGDDLDTVRLDNVRRDDDHTAEDVVVAARGPGAERVRGFLSSTDVFRIMMDAYGWEEAGAAWGR
jgi:alkaline phosphatase